MPYKIYLFLLTLSGEFSHDLFNFLVAFWFLAVGYLLLKKANSRLGFSTRNASAVGQPILEPNPSLRA